MHETDPLENASIAVLDGDAPVAIPPAEAAYDGPVCSHCEAPMKPDQVACRRCGYYPSLGIQVELDSEWEGAVDPDCVVARDEPKSAVQEFVGAIPPWAWPLVTSNLAIVAISLAGRLLLPADSTLFEFWGVWQLVIGLAVVGVLHLVCFVMTASTDTTVGLFDVLASPMKAWFKTASRLPERQWLVTGASNGIVMSLCAVAIVGGIQWERLWDWGIEQPTDSSLVEAIASAAGNGPSNEEGLEEAVQDFAGQAGNVEGAGDQQKKTKPEPEIARQTSDCLIIGFEMNELEQISKLHLATEKMGRFVYAGSLEPDFDPAVAQQLKYNLTHARAGSPLVQTGVVANWVQPRFPVRISYTAQAGNGRLREMQIEKLLPPLQLPW